MAHAGESGEEDPQAHALVLRVQLLQGQAVQRLVGDEYLPGFLHHVEPGVLVLVFRADGPLALLKHGAKAGDHDQVPGLEGKGVVHGKLLAVSEHGLGADVALVQVLQIGRAVARHGRSLLHLVDPGVGPGQGQVFALLQLPAPPPSSLGQIHRRLAQIPLVEQGKRAVTIRMGPREPKM